MSNSLVIDASFALRLITPNKERQLFMNLVSQWIERGYSLFAPSLWTYEVTSAICKLVRFNQLTETQGRETLKLANEFNVQIMHPDTALSERAFAWTLQLNRAAAYDSFYLALAESLNCDLWTADKRLVNVVNRPWVRLAGTSDQLA